MGAVRGVVGRPGMSTPPEPLSWRESGKVERMTSTIAFNDLGDGRHSPGSARMRLLRGLCSTLARPSASMTGGT